MELNLENLQSAQKFAAITARGGRSSNSITVTFTDTNGKRVTLSNGLISNLNLKEKVFIGVLTESRQLIIANHRIDGMDEYKISKNTIYNSGLVSGIVEVFELHPFYQEHSSKSFTDIEFDEEQGIAIIAIPTAEAM